MNSIKQLNGEYVLNDTIKCKVWDEHKNGTTRTHIVLPKGNETGRTYITKSIIDNEIDRIGEYKFDSKLSGPRVLGSKLTEEGQELIADLQRQIDEIKNDPKYHSTKEEVDKDSIEYLEMMAKKWADKVAARKA